MCACVYLCVYWGRAQVYVYACTWVCAVLYIRAYVYAFVFNIPHSQSHSNNVPGTDRSVACGTGLNAYLSLEPMEMISPTC